MALFTMADLHLSVSTNKKMDVFGSRWQGYTDKIVKNWRQVVTDTDTVVVGGDISWGMNFKEAQQDFELLNSLPGKKLLLKGNHDFWWDTATKCHKFFKENAWDTLELLFNNAFVVEDFIVCGTRGWFLEKEQQLTVGEVDYEKISNRELLRLRATLNAARQLQVGEHADKEILVFLHFPPVWGEFYSHKMLEEMRAFGVKRCYFGHIHGNYTASPKTTVEGLSLHLVSSDFLNFTPLAVKPIDKA